VRKLYKLLAIIVLLALSYFVYVYINNPINLNPNLSSKYLLFTKGSKQDILEYFKKPENKVVQSDILFLIDRDMLDIIELLLEKHQVNPDIGGDMHGFTPLTYSAENLKVKAVDLFVKYGADVNFKSDNNRTALVKASNQGVNLDIKRQNLSNVIVKKLVNSGAKVNDISDYKESALGGATIANNMERINFLVENGANINTLDMSKQNYLFYCDSEECIKYFLDKGLDINSLDVNGKNILQSAIKSSWVKLNLYKKIINYGLDICHKDNDGKSILNFAELGDVSESFKSSNPEYYNKAITKNKQSAIYKYLVKEYQTRCLDKHNQRGRSI